jgi:hypothetical protein
MEFWFAGSSFSGAQQELVKLVGYNGGVRLIQIQLQFGDLGFYDGAASGCTHTGAVGFDDGAPHMVDVTLDGTNVRTYLDGILCGTTPDTHGTWNDGAAPGVYDEALGADAGSACCGGGGPGGNPILPGTYLGQVSFYPVALSGARIAAHYAAR